MLKTAPKHSRTSFSFCQNCFEKQLLIDKLQDENQRLKQRIKILEKRNKDGYFGSSTPSSKKPFKEKAKAENKKKKGGAVKGHIGYGRKKINEEDADIIESISGNTHCPSCGSKLIYKETINRSIIDIEPIKVVKKISKYHKNYCPQCKKTIANKPIILPKSLYGNRLLAHMSILHYFHGIPMKRVARIIDASFPERRLHMIFHRLSKLFKDTVLKIIEEYRQETVKHADETGWRIDGDNGYAWIFCSKNNTVFKFTNTRSAKICKEILGEKQLAGVLVVDRYGAYNKVWCNLQYCYSHLLRMIDDYGKKYPEKTEVQNFVNTLIPLLSQAIRLRKMNIKDVTYYKKAKEIKEKILKVINTGVKDFGLDRIQMIFKEKEKRLYHWVENRNVPAENNKAERELRPTVIARKISFGSQSIRGADTRSTLMTIIHTAQKRLKNQTLEELFTDILNKISVNSRIDPYSLLPPPSP